jgi:hypothetical protein
MHVLILGGAGFSGQALIRHFDGERPTADFTVVSRTARRLFGSLELSDAHFRQCFRWAPVVETRAALSEMVR